MKKISFQNATFLQSAYSLSDCPTLLQKRGHESFEIAIVGRSNVGKSSLINHLLQNTKVARISSTPGKTQAINFYFVDELLFLVDLPGYGYAKVTKTLKEKWSVFLEDYFTKRNSLSLILLLLDIRRDPSSEDAAFFSWAQYHNKPILIVFTKCDKINPGEVEMRTQQIHDKLTALGVSYSFSHVHVSIKNSHSRLHLIDKINLLLKSV